MTYVDVNGIRNIAGDQVDPAELQPQIDLLTRIDELLVRIGEVVPEPNADTISYRLKEIKDELELGIANDTANTAAITNSVDSVALVVELFKDSFNTRDIATSAKQLLNGHDVHLTEDHTRDIGNEPSSLLLANEVFIGEYSKYSGHASGLLLYAAFQPFTALGRWSDDGVNPDTSLLGVIPYEISFDEATGYYFFVTPLETILQNYLRIEISNGVEDQTPGAFGLMIKRKTALSGSVSTLNSSLGFTSIVQNVRAVAAGSDPSGNFVTQNIGGLYAEQTSSALLPGGGEFVYDGWSKTDGYGSVQLAVFAAQPLDDTAYTDASGQTGGVLIEVSVDGVNKTTDFIIKTARNPPAEVAIFTLAFPYFRVRYKNGPLNQTWFNVLVFAYTGPPTAPIRSVDSEFTGAGLAITTRTVSFGKRPDGKIQAERIQGVHSGNSSTVPLNAGGVFRGTWTRWLDDYIKIVTTMKSDAPGVLYIDFSAQETPVDGDDSSIDGSMVVDEYEPTTSELTRRHTPLQSLWARVRYVNGPAGQTTFNLNTGFLVSDPGLVLETMDKIPVANNLAGLVRAISTISDGMGGYQEVPVDADGIPEVSVTTVNGDVLLRPLPTWQVRQFSISDTAAWIDEVKLPNRRSVQVKNHSASAPIWIGHSDSLTVNNGELIPPYGSSGMMLSTAGDIYAIGAEAGVSGVIIREAGSASGTCINPNNALLSDDTRALFNAPGQTLTLSTLTPGTSNEITRVRIGVEGRKAAEPISQTVSWLTSQTATAQSGTITVLNVSAGNDILFIADIALAADNNVTGVSGGGMVWVRSGIAAVSPSNRVTRWYATGSPASTFNVVATLNSSGRVNMSVSSYSGADLNNPLENPTSLNASATNFYSNNVIGSAIGMVIVAVAFGNVTHTAGSDATERSETVIGTGGNAISLATTTEQITVTGNQTYAGTFSNTSDIATAVACIVPAPSLPPILRIGYAVSGVPGDTFNDIELPSLDDTINISTNITEDRTWLATDIVNVEISATALDVSTYAEVDHMYLEITDFSGAVSRISLKEIA